MDNLLESLFLCYDNSSDYWKIERCKDRTTFFAGVTTVPLSKTVFMGV